MEDPDWEALAKAVRARRADLGLSQGAVTAAGGPSDLVISRIENNEEPRPRLDTLRKLDRGLSWEPGTSKAHLAGAPAAAPSPPPRVRVNRGGQWIEVDPNAPSNPRTTPEEQLEWVTAATQRQADVVSEILLLPLKLTPTERARIEHISTQIAQLPEVLAPWLDTPAGIRQYLHQTTTYLDEAQSILGAARQRSHPPEAISAMTAGPRRCTAAAPSAS